MCDNALASLRPGVFDQLTNLTVLNLYFNPLTALPAGIFDQLTQLQELRIYATHLSELRPGVFDRLTELRLLLMHRTHLDELPPGVFDNLTNLTTLELWGNDLKALAPGLFRKLTSLVELSLHNGLLDVDILPLDNRDLSYSPYELSPLTRLTTLDGEPYTRPDAPGAPGGLAATPASGRIELSWTAPSGGAAATSYQILRQAGAGTEEVYVEDTFHSGGNAVTYTDTGVTGAVTYRYRVKALNGGGASGASNQASVAYPIGTDATLSALTLSAGALWPAFASGTTVYAAAAADTVMRIAVTPAPTDGNATVAFLDGNDDALDDADSATDGHQVDLDMGANVIKVKVTAEDGVATETYTVTVTREASVSICARTEQVRTAILAAAQVSASECALVLPGELARIASLDLTGSRHQGQGGRSIGSLHAGDFDGLTGLTTLDLSSNELEALRATCSTG